MKRATIRYIDELDYSGNEALNTICSNLAFAGRDLRKIVMTSCNAGEGKSYLTMQIAQNIGRRGKRVVIVDADMRRSFIIKKYDMRTEGEWKGLVHYLAGMGQIKDVLYATNLTNVYIIPAGRDVANPVPLIDTPYFSDLLDMLASQFDIVLVDAPPVGLVIDAAEIAQSCDGAVFVIEYNKTRRRDIHNAQKQMAQAECPILGCIINKVSFDTISSKKYYNKYYYSHYSNGYYRKSSAKTETKADEE